MVCVLTFIRKNFIDIDDTKIIELLSVNFIIILNYTNTRLKIMKINQNKLIQNEFKVFCPFHFENRNNHIHIKIFIVKKSSPKNMIWNSGNEILYTPHWRDWKKNCRFYVSYGNPVIMFQ